MVKLLPFFFSGEIFVIVNDWNHIIYEVINLRDQTQKFRLSRETDGGIKRADNKGRIFLSNPNQGNDEI